MKILLSFWLIAQTLAPTHWNENSWIVPLWEYEYSIDRPIPMRNKTVLTQQLSDALQQQFAGKFHNKAIQIMGQFLTYFLRHNLLNAYDAIHQRFRMDSQPFRGSFQISVNYDFKNHELIYHISDNGIGIDESMFVHWIQYYQSPDLLIPKTTKTEYDLQTFGHLGFGMASFFWGWNINSDNIDPIGRLLHPAKERPGINHQIDIWSYSPKDHQGYHLNLPSPTKKQDATSANFQSERPPFKFQKVDLPQKGTIIQLKIKLVEPDQNDLRFKKTFSISVDEFEKALRSVYPVNFRKTERPFFLVDPNHSLMISA